MKNPFLSFFACLLLLCCHNVTPSAGTAEAPSEVASSDLLGPISRADLKKPPHSEWFESEYETYQVEPAALATADFSGVEMVVLMGTWCSDSQREIPRLFKVLDAADFPPGKFSMIAVDEAKEQPAEAIEKWDVVYVPTIIVLRNGQELGRIVESPDVSLEADLAATLFKG